MINTLLVDPDSQSRKRLLEQLDWYRLGYEIQAPEPQTFEEVLHAIDKESFDLVIISLRALPSFSMRLCEQIRKHSTASILLIGGSKQMNIVHKAIMLKVSDYLPDPYDAQDLEVCLVNLRSSIRRQEKAAGQPSTSSACTTIEMIKRYVQEQLHQNITLKKISDELHFNCAYLGQKFKRHEKMSFNEYLLQQRMEKAKRLLIESDLKIYEIAHRVGYSEVDWFYKKFKEYTGVSANEYRKKMKDTA
ncbi:putative two-component response regulator [Insulibacter thermoxylanivorax]|uniref:Two-component response regulator n=2 Tax=Insulibacter thermoxylanivorax TaxID=2749268 RepID=A0A916QA21_9BACL|nr:putative two-component response regulator [Insulibacter thermoxylanivorax]